MNAKSRLQQWVDSLPDSAENMTAEQFLATFGQISLTNEDWIFQALDLGLSKDETARMCNLLDSPR